MSCIRDIECIYQFLIYPQRLLNFTHKLFGMENFFRSRRLYISSYY